MDTKPLRIFGGAFVLITALLAVTACGQFFMAAYPRSHICLDIEKCPTHHPRWWKSRGPTGDLPGGASRMSIAAPGTLRGEMLQRSTATAIQIM